MTAVQRFEDKLNNLGQEIDELRQTLHHTVVAQAAEIGQRLIQAKRIAEHGQWLPWLRERKMSVRSAQNYMKMARYFNVSNTKQRFAFAQQSYREALKAIQEPDDAAPRESVDELSAKRRFEQKRAEEIGKLATKLDAVAGKYGSGAVEAALNTYQKPDQFQSIIRSVGDVTNALIKPPKPTLVSDAADATAPKTTDAVWAEVDDEPVETASPVAASLKDAWIAATLPERCSLTGRA